MNKSAMLTALYYAGVVGRLHNRPLLKQAVGETAEQKARSNAQAFPPMSRAQSGDVRTMRNHLTQQYQNSPEYARQQNLAKASPTTTSLSDAEARSPELRARNIAARGDAQMAAANTARTDRGYSTDAKGNRNYSQMSGSIGTKGQPGYAMGSVTKATPFTNTDPNYQTPQTASAMKTRAMEPVRPASGGGGDAFKAVRAGNPTKPSNSASINSARAQGKTLAGQNSAPTAQLAKSVPAVSQQAKPAPAAPQQAKPNFVNANQPAYKMPGPDLSLFRFKPSGVGQGKNQTPAPAKSTIPATAPAKSTIPATPPGQATRLVPKAPWSENPDSKSILRGNIIGRAANNLGEGSIAPGVQPTGWRRGMPALGGGPKAWAAAHAPSGYNEFRSNELGSIPASDTPQRRAIAKNDAFKKRIGFGSTTQGNQVIR